MESNGQKRKLETTDRCENKKIHNDNEFSSSEISAESTQIEDQSVSDIVDKVLNDGSSKDEEDSDDISDSELEGLITICQPDEEDKNKLKESLKAVQRQLENYTDELRKERVKVWELSEKVLKLEREKEELLQVQGDNDTKIQRYRTTIIHDCGKEDLCRRHVRATERYALFPCLCYYSTTIIDDC